jgi:hypothetical protein
MNATFTRNPSPRENQLAQLASDKARRLVSAYAKEVGDSHEWPNRDNVHNTGTHLLAYIAELERKS